MNAANASDYFLLVFKLDNVNVCHFFLSLAFHSHEAVSDLTIFDAIQFTITGVIFTISLKPYSLKMVAHISQLFM